MNGKRVTGAAYPMQPYNFTALARALCLVQQSRTFLIAEDKRFLRICGVRIESSDVHYTLWVVKILLRNDEVLIAKFPQPVE